MKHFRHKTARTHKFLGSNNLILQKLQKNIKISCFFLSSFYAVLLWWVKIWDSW